MRRGIVLVLCAVMLLGVVSPASAGWFRVRHHFGHVRHFGHHYRHWVHRPYFHHRHYYGHRYVYRYPRYSSFGYRHHGYPWWGVVRRYVPVYYNSYYYSYPVYGGYYPYCASYTPSVSYGYGYADASTAQPAAGGSKIIEFARQPATAAALLASYRKTLPETPKDSSGRTFRTAEDQLLNYGDRLFRGEFFAEALAKYDAAAGVASQVAEVHVRRGYALVSVGRYAEAAAAFRRSLDLNPRLLKSDFRSAELYGSQSAARSAQVERLAGAALQAERDADLYFLLGVLLHGEGQVERARLFFRQAAELAGPGAAHLEVFLGEEQPAQWKWASRPAPGERASETTWKFASHVR